MIFLMKRILLLGLASTMVATARAQWVAGTDNYKTPTHTVTSVLGTCTGGATVPGYYGTVTKWFYQFAVCSGSSVASCPWTLAYQTLYNNQIDPYSLSKNVTVPAGETEYLVSPLTTAGGRQTWVSSTDSTNVQSRQQSSQFWSEEKMWLTSVKPS